MVFDRALGVMKRVLAAEGCAFDANNAKGERSWQLQVGSGTWNGFVEPCVLGCDDVYACGRGLRFRWRQPQGRGRHEQVWVLQQGVSMP